MDSDLEAEHFNQQRKRKAEFIKPPNTLKKKVGSGGLGDDILDKAQKLLEENTQDFQPLAYMYLDNLMRGIEMAKEHSTNDDPESVFAHMLYPAMQLKANGGMFHYPLVTEIADRLIQFLEVIEDPEIEAIEIILAFHSTLRAIIQGRVTSDGGQYGRELVNALNEACLRYFAKRT